MRFALSYIVGFAVAGCGGQVSEFEMSSPGRSVGTARGAVTGDNLGGANLGGTNLGGTNLGGPNLGGTNLGGPNLGGPNLGGTNLGGTNLGGPNLGGTNLGGANLAGTNLVGTNLGGTNLGGPNLGGTNLGGTNLAGTNLVGSNLGGPNLGGPNLGGTNLGGANLGGPDTGRNIHELSPVGAALLASGEDLWDDGNPNTDSRCIVLGMGSLAFSNLVRNNPGHMKAVLRQLNWSFSNTYGQLQAWEAVVFGVASASNTNPTYCSFILAAPSEATYAGLKGFIKAIWRWNAPVGRNLEIPQVANGSLGAGVDVPLDTFGGMMGMADRVVTGVVAPYAHIAGEYAFVSATTNNVPVNVDFASWVRDSNNAGLVLGSVEGQPVVADGAFTALERIMDDGTIGPIELKVFALPDSQHAISTFDFINDRTHMAENGSATPAVPKRCSGALEKWDDPSYIPVKCDAYISAGDTTTLTDYDRWSNDDTQEFPYWMFKESAAAKPVPVMQYSFSNDVTPFQRYRVISQTYVHLNENPIENLEWMSPSTGRTCRDVATGAWSVLWCIDKAGTEGGVYRWNVNRNPVWTRDGTLTGTRIATDDAQNGALSTAWLVKANGDVYMRASQASGNWTRKVRANATSGVGCRDIAASKSGTTSAHVLCIGIGNGSNNGLPRKWNWTTSVFDPLPQLPGGMIGNRIAVTHHGVPHVATTTGAAYKLVAGAWTQITPNNCYDIGVNALGVFCTDSNNNVLKKGPNDSAWVSLGQTATAVAAGSRGGLFVADPTGLPRYYH